MIITQAPLRISFLGGGTDFPRHFMEHGGAVLSTAIHHSAYVTVQDFHSQFFDHSMRIAYRKAEAPHTIDEIEHPVIRECLRKLSILKDIEIHHMADLPGRTGLGSSSSFTVALLMALHAQRGEFRSARQLADEAIELERDILKEAGGIQDQVIAAYGGICLIRFDASRRFTVHRLPLEAGRCRELQDRMLLFYSGVRRLSHSVQNRFVDCLVERRAVLEEMAKLAETGVEGLLGDQPISEFGRLLHRTWSLKRSLAKVSLPELDSAYEAGMRAGASGGKLLGAGCGGFLLFIAEPECHDELRRALHPMKPLRVRIGAPGCRVIHADREYD